MPVAAQLIDATKKYGAVEALKGVSLDIELGDVVAMLGPNGAGKTTSISLLLGLRKPTSGKAQLFGLDPSDLNARSRVGVMLQESGIPEMLKVREIVDLFRSYYPKPMARDRAIADGTCSGDLDGGTGGEGKRARQAIVRRPAPAAVLRAGRLWRSRGPLP
jgi:ABC-2 type transport system ATP-binding protein